MMHADGQQPSEFTPWESCYTGMHSNCAIYDNDYSRMCPKRPIWSYEISSFWDIVTKSQNFDDFMELLIRNLWVVFVWFKFW